MKKILALLILAFFASCGGKQAEKDKAVAESADTQRDAFFANVHSPRQVAAFLQSIAADYNPSLLSDPSKFSSYTTSDVKAAANLGIYLSDMNYCIAYKKGEATKGYVNAVLELGATMGLQKDVLQYIGKRYEGNINQNDSLKAAYDQLYNAATSSLKGTDKEKLVGIAIAAYQIENLHLLAGIIHTYPKDMLPNDARTAILVPVFKQLFKQGDNVRSIYSFLKIAGNPDNPNYYYYSNAFEELIGSFDKLKVSETISNNDGVALLSDAVVAELNDKIDNIRNKAMEP